MYIDISQKYLCTSIKCTTKPKNSEKLRVVDNLFLNIVIIYTKENKQRTTRSLKNVFHLK